MTKYTAGAAALPYPEGVDKVAVHSDIQALATATDTAISAEGGRAEAAAKAYADVEVGKDRVRLGTLETAVPKALADAKTYADVEVGKDRARIATTEAHNQRQDHDIRQTLRNALAYADSKAQEIQAALDTSHIALDTDGTPYYRPGSTTVKVLQDTDGTPFYKAD